jgi:hypothetical protein
MRKYLDEERMTTTLRAVGWTWLALSAASYVFIICSAWWWEGLGSLVAIFERSGSEIALGAAEVMAPGVAAVLVAHVLKARS